MNLNKIIAFSVGPIGAALLSFVTLPIITWFFVPEDIGRIAMLQVVIGFCVLLFSLGLDQAYVREYHESSNTAELFKTSLLPGVGVLVVSLSIVLILPISIAKLIFGLDDPLIELIVIMSLLSAFVSRFLSLILRMQERGIAFSMSQLLPKLVFLVVISGYIVLLNKFTFFYLLVAHLISITSITLVFMWNTRDTLLIALHQQINVLKLQEMLRFGMPLIMGGLAFWGLTTMDKLFLRSMSTFQELALYSVAVSFATAAIIFQSVFSTIWAPTVYKWAVEGVNLSKVDKVTDYVLFVILLMFSLAGLLSWLVTYLLPSEYADVQYLVVCCMAYPLFYTLSEVTVIGLGIKKKSTYSMLASLLAFLINIAGNYILVPIWGAKGAAVSTAASFWFFLVLRTEFASMVWRPLPRVWLYISTAICLVISIAFTLYGDLYSNYFVVAWIIIFLGSMCLNNKVLRDLYTYIRAR